MCGIAKWFLMNHNRVRVGHLVEYITSILYEITVYKCPNRRAGGGSTSVSASVGWDL